MYTGPSAQALEWPVLSFFIYRVRVTMSLSVLLYFKQPIVLPSTATFSVKVPQTKVSVR